MDTLDLLDCLQIEQITDGFALGEEIKYFPLSMNFISPLPAGRNFFVTSELSNQFQVSLAPFEHQIQIEKWFLQFNETFQFLFCQLLDWFANDSLNYCFMMDTFSRMTEWFLPYAQSSSSSQMPQNVGSLCNRHFRVQWVQHRSRFLK